MALANEKFQVKSYPSPFATDVLFFEIRDSVLPKNKQPEYGQPHEDVVKWPNHVLVFISQAPRDYDGKQMWWYAAKRANQDEYNWAFSEADIGGTKFKSVVREYVTLRSEFDPVTPAQGSAMADVPREKFAGTYVLAERAQLPSPTQEIASLFVFEKLTYVQKVSLTDNVFNEDLNANLSSATTLYYRGETVGGTPIETLVANEKSTYWGLTGTTARLGQQLSTNWFLVVEKKISVRRGADGNYTDAWPLKQIKSRGTEASIPTLYADQVSTIETITRETLEAVNVDDIPDPSLPVGIEARNLHKKINDLFYEKSVLSQEFNLTGEIVETDIEQRPYVKITQNTKGELTSSVPGAGMGSSKLIWKGGQQRLFANMDQDSVARPGLKGFDKEVTPWGYILERTDYSENYQDGEKSRVIYDDGETRVYEVSNLSEVFVDPSGTTKDKDPQAWGYSVWNGVYGTAEDDSADRIKVIWQRAGYKVWLNEKVTAEISGGTRDKDPQQWGTLTWLGTYSATEDPEAERSRQVWRIGDQRVFLNESVSVEVGGTTVDKDPQQWGSLAWNGTYATSSSGDRSRQVWRLGDTSVFLNETVSVEVSGTTKDRDPQQWGSLTWNGIYGTSEDTGSDRSRQVWRLGDTSVFLNETVAVTVGGSTVDKDPQQWGSLLWNGTYATTLDSEADRARQVWRLGDTTVYLNENVTVTTGGSTRDKDPQQWGSLTWNGTYSTIFDGSADRSRQVWRLGDTSVYLNEEATVEANGVTKDVNPQQWGSLIWSGTYGTAPSEAANARVSQVFRLDSVSVYRNEEPSITVAGGSYVSYREENALLIETHTTSYGLGPTTGVNSRSRIAFALGELRVYENTEIVRTSKGTRTYPGTVNVDIPPVLTALNAVSFVRRDGQDTYHYNPTINPGYRGPMPCAVEEYWKENPGDGGVTALIFKPDDVAFTTPVGGFSVRSVLHGDLNGYIRIGTQHPVYAYSQYDYLFPATTPASVPSSFIADVNSQPYQDGYITRIYRVTLT